MSAQISCDCDRLFPGSAPSLAIDDWFCPRCQRAVTTLEPDPDCRELAGSPGESANGKNSAIHWLYSQSSGSNPLFVLELNLDRPTGTLRETERIAPTVSSVEFTAGFGWRAEVEQGADGRRARILITPQTAVAIPPQGLQRSVLLKGNFPETEVHLRLLPDPKPEWRVRGRGIETTRNAQTGTWRILRTDVRSLEIDLRTDGVPLQLRYPLDVERKLRFTLQSPDPTRGLLVDYALDSQPPAGTTITDENPATWDFSVRFDEEGCRKGDVFELLFWPSFVARKPQPERIRFLFDPAPLQFLPEEGFTVPELFWGELCDNDPHGALRGQWFDSRHSPIGRLVLRNEGDEPVQLRQPTVSKYDSTNSANFTGWLTVGWMPGQIATEGSVVIEPGTELEIFIQIDLSRPPANPPERLAAEIRIATQTDETDWTTRIEVLAVRQRTACPMPLVVDFGNTASFAAMTREGLDIPHDDAAHELLEIHGGVPGQPIPTRLVLNEFNPQQPLSSTYVIGGDCDRVRKRLSFRVQADLKRWLARPKGDIERPVVDDAGQMHRIKPSVLVQLFLWGVIRRAEAMLRRYWIERIILTYPSKLRPDARDRLHTLLEALCDAVNALGYRGAVRMSPGKAGDGELAPDPFADSPAGESVSPVGEPYGVDEANAIVSGFVMPLQTPPRQMIVASFDLGGGSLDTALVHFECENPDALVPEYVSEYWGIGGFADFGGDNVTVAVLDLLRQRLGEAANDDLQRRLAELPTPANYTAEAGQRREIYDLLWRLADDYKVFRCSARDSASAVNWFRDWKPPAELPPAALDEWNSTWVPQIEKLADQKETSKSCWPSLDEICTHPIQEDHFGRRQPYTVEERIESAIDEVLRFLKRHSQSLGPTRENDSPPAASDADTPRPSAFEVIHHVVVAGRGSHLPLLRAKLQEKLVDRGHVQSREWIHFEPHRLKWQVAEGLARAVRFCDRGQTGLVRSGEFTSSPIGCLLALGGVQRCVLIPVCTRIGDEVSLKFQRHLENGGTQPCSPWDFVDRGKLTLYGDVDRREAWEIGSVTLPPRPQAKNKAECWLVLCGSESSIELRIRMSRDADQEYRLEFKRPAE